jgi:thioredoxin-dependent peroxiredoxin
MYTTDEVIDMLKPGTSAPAFCAQSTEGTIHLQDYFGKKNIVLIFYPGDDTPVCTKQLCGIQERYSDLEKLDTVVFGINPANLNKHEAFAGKFGYSFPLIVDEDEQIRHAYDVGKILGLFFQQRIVYIIGKDQTIIYSKKGNPPVAELMQVIAALPK